MMKSSAMVLLVVLSMQMSACSTSRARLLPGYDDPAIKVSNGTVSGKSLGPVRGNEGGAIWVDCDKSASNSMRELIAQAKDLGANAVGDIKWYATGTNAPGCKKGWGYLVIWPFILTPLFMSSAVDGVAYKVDGSSSRSGLYMIPNDAAGTEMLIQQLVAQTAN